MTDIMRLRKKIVANGNKLSNQQAIDLLGEIGIIDEGKDKLQWSVLYNLTSGDINLFAHRNMKNIITGSLRMK